MTKGYQHRTGSKNVVANVWSDAAREAAAEARREKAKDQSGEEYTGDQRTFFKMGQSHAQAGQAPNQFVKLTHGEANDAAYKAGYASVSQGAGKNPMEGRTGPSGLKYGPNRTVTDEQGNQFRDGKPVKEAATGQPSTRSQASQKKYPPGEVVSPRSALKKFSKTDF